MKKKVTYSLATAYDGAISLGQTMKLCKKIYYRKINDSQMNRKIYAALKKMVRNRKKMVLLSD